MSVHAVKWDFEAFGWIWADSIALHFWKESGQKKMNSSVTHDSCFLWFSRPFGVSASLYFPMYSNNVTNIICLYLPFCYLFDLLWFCQLMMACFTAKSTLDLFCVLVVFCSAGTLFFVEPENTPPPPHGNIYSNCSWENSSIMPVKINRGQTEWEGTAGYPISIPPLCALLMHAVKHRGGPWCRIRAWMNLHS